MQTCPDCHALVNDSAVFCDNCGFRLKPAASGSLNQVGGGLVSPPAGSGRINPMMASAVAVNAAPGSCSACGYINTPGEMFCQNCGVQLAPVASVPPPPPTPVSSAGVQLQSSQGGLQSIAPNGPVACPTCGYANPPDETFCQNCGVALAAGTQPPTPSGILHSNPQPSSSISQTPAPRPQPLISTTPGVCPTCNYKNSPGEAYCQNCGMELVSQKPPVASAPSVCPSCGDVPPPSAVFCPNCGMDFAANQQSPVASPQSRDTGAQPPIPESQVSTSCPTCGYTNLPGETYCQNCGLLLVAPDTLPQAASPAAMLTGETPPASLEPEPESPIPTLQFPPSIPPSSAPDTKPLTPLYAPPITSSRPPTALVGRLVVAETQASLPLPAGKAEFLIGRPDPAGGIFPDIDLSLHGGETGGVSRQHARLTVNDGQVLIEDLHSLNSTFLNKQWLAPEQRFPLNDGDEIRLGGLVLNFQSS